MIRKFFRRLSLVPRGLRYKLMVAFSLMSIIPLLVCGYLANTFIFPNVQNMKQASVVLLLSIFVSLLGLILAKRLVDPVIDMALEAKIIASGEYDRKIKTGREDEIGELGSSINAMTKQIRDYLDELHSYSIRTKDLNIEIQRKILALSGLLQIGESIAASEDLGNIYDLVTEKITEVFEDSVCALYKVREGNAVMELQASHNGEDRDLKALKFALGEGYVGKALGAKIAVMIDSSTKMTRDLENIKKDFQVTNCLILPVIARRQVVGFLFIGSSLDSFKYKDDDVELIKVLAKQIGLAVENDLLMHRAEEVAFKDGLTGLYNETYIKSRLDEEIHRAILCQRPCSFLKFNLDDFRAYRDNHSQLETEEVIKKVADIIKSGSTELSKVARLGADEFAVILPEKNKKEAHSIAEDIRAQIERIGTELAGKNENPLTISGGVSENPIDGTTADELFSKAAELLTTAKREGKNKVVA